MHLWKNAKPHPCIRGKPFWIHSTEEKFELKSIQFVQWTGRDGVSFRDLRLMTEGQSHCLGHEFRLKSTASRHHLSAAPTVHQVRCSAISLYLKSN